MWLHSNDDRAASTEGSAGLYFQEDSLPCRVVDTGYQLRAHLGLSTIPIHGFSMWFGLCIVWWLCSERGRSKPECSDRQETD